ncbi:MAG: CocE/NonD family hydrolase [Chlamydiia bacterium]|nr:CocE/NonD family hydrolase [Chlamydiia bacterium]
MKKSLFALFIIISVALFAKEEVKPDMTLKVPMRDGKELLTDIYLPTPRSRSLPTILVRSPSGRHAAPALAALDFVKSGYMVAIQETRSASDQDGKIMPCIHDGWGESQDGYDTVEWLSKSRLSNGKIGTTGPSALGISQLMLAPTAPEALKAQFIQFACGSIYHHAAYSQGQLMKHQIESWLSYYAKDPCHKELLRRERHYNDFWAGMDSNARAHAVQVPALFVGGWFDMFLEGTLVSFKARQEEGAPGAKGKQKLIIGPWAHFWPVETKIGDFAVPDQANKLPDAFSPLKWFDFYLKGIDNGVERLPAVTYYVMGPFDGSPSKGNRWRTAATWPIPSKPASLHLTADQGLSFEKDFGRDKCFRYLYDPNDPTPTVGGRNLFLESGPKDQRPIEERSDVLVFTSPELKEDLEVTGSIKAKLYVSTDCDDTDVVVRLTDVYPDGRSILITDNTARLGSFFPEHPSLSNKHHARPHEIEVDLHATSLVFAKGHKIRVSITSSNYPRFEKNLNVRLDAHGNPVAPPKVAVNSIWVGSDYPSQLILPVIP